MKSLSLQLYFEVIGEGLKTVAELSSLITNGVDQELVVLTTNFPECETAVAIGHLEPIGR